MKRKNKFNFKNILILVIILVFAVYLLGFFEISSTKQTPLTFEKQNEIDTQIKNYVEAHASELNTLRTEINTYNDSQNWYSNISFIYADGTINEVILKIDKNTLLIECIQGCEFKENINQYEVDKKRAEQAIDLYSNAYAYALGSSHRRITTYKENNDWYSDLLFTNIRTSTTNEVKLKADGKTFQITCIEGCDLFKVN